MVSSVHELSPLNDRSDVHTQVDGPQEGPGLPEMQDEEEDDELDSSDSMPGSETRMPMWVCLRFTICLSPAILSRSEQVYLASSNLLRMHLALAGTCFNCHCHHHAVCTASFGHHW